jgi:hypothetical protein
VWVSTPSEENEMSIKSAISGTSPSGEKITPVGNLSAIGGIIGVVAAALGLVLSAGASLLPLPSSNPALFTDSVFTTNAGIFIALLTIGMLFQAIGSRNFRNYVGSSIATVSYLVFALGLIIAVSMITGPMTTDVNFYAQPIGSGTAVTVATIYVGYVTNLMTLFAIFAIFWQTFSTTYVDSSKNWLGFVASICNGFFIPLMAIGQVLGPLVIYLAYALLLVGQLFVFLFWRSPFDNLREYARSPEKAKFAFGFTGLLTVVVGLVPILVGPLDTIEDVVIWKPWSAVTVVETGSSWNIIFQTNPVLVFGLCSALIFWVTLAPRLGAKELRQVAIGDDLVKGGVKWFMLLLAAMGIWMASQSGIAIDDFLATILRDTRADTLRGIIQSSAGNASLWLSVCPAAVFFFMGGLYAGNTDIISGIPLAAVGIFLLVHPYVLPLTVIIPYLLVILTQFFLMLETKFRGLTAFQQPALTVIVSLISSTLFLFFILGVFGQGPNAIWPVNKWFNVSLFAGIPVAVQAATILVLPIAAILVRNVAIAGYAHGRGYSGSEVLMGLSALFALMIPIIAGAVKGIASATLTAASLMMALYAISFVLVLSLNLNLAGDVEATDNPYEGMLVRVTTIVGIAFGAIVAVIVMATFSGFPTTDQIAVTITLLVTLVVGLEVLSLLSWTIAGVRLGMLSKGWRYRSKLE